MKKITATMEEARLKNNLPQEGTGGESVGESLSEHCSGSPANSGGGKGLLPKEITMEIPKKTLTQQLFHPGLFSRQRSSSLSDATENNRKIEYNPNAPYQRIPTQKRSPDDSDPRINLLKRSQKQNQMINTNRGINNQEPNTNLNIATSNSFALLDVEETDIPVKRIPKPPPIILYSVEDLSKLTPTIEEVKKDFTYKIVSKNQLIISTSTVDKYKTMIEQIRNKGLIGYTFTRKDQKCMRIIIKHLHFSTPKDEIIAAIEKTGNSVQGEIVTARKPGTKEPLNTFFVNVAQHERNKLVKDIKVIYNQRVLIEDPKRKKSIVQCKRCQQYGHSKNNCMRPYRCVKCAGAHETTMCTVNANTPAICTLCSGSHPASYKGCQVYREVLARKRSTNKLKTHQKENINDAEETSTVPKTNNALIKATIECDDAVKYQAAQSIFGDLTAAQCPQLYSESVKNGKQKYKQSTIEKVIDLTDTQNAENNFQITHTRNYNDNTQTQRTYARNNGDSTQSQRTYFKNNAGHAPQRKQMTKTETENASREHRPSLEALIITQTERIDQLITQLSTMMNLIVTLISKLSK